MQDWSSIHPLYQVPGVKGVSRFYNWGLHGNVNHDDLTSLFPDHDWDFLFGIRADTVPPLVSASIVYAIDGTAERHTVIRFMARGGTTPRIYTDGLRSWSGSHEEVLRSMSWEGENGDEALQIALDLANP